MLFLFINCVERSQAIKINLKEINKVIHISQITIPVSDAIQIESNNVSLTHRCRIISTNKKRKMKRKKNIKKKPHETFPHGK